MNSFERQLLFQQLYQSWKVETEFKSFHDTEHFSYKEIVKMGKDVIPLLLHNLGDSWLSIVALHEITGETPFTNDIAGKFKELSLAWYLWGQEKDYIK